MADEVHVTEGVDRGRVVNDQGQAYELAYLAKGGMDAALRREKELAEGLTDEEKENLRVIESLPGMYPNAFIPDVDGTPVRTDLVTGRSYLVVAPLGGDGECWVIGQKGVARFSGFKGLDIFAFARSGADLDGLLGHAIGDLDKEYQSRVRKFTTTGRIDGKRYSFALEGEPYRTAREAVEGRNLFKLSIMGANKNYEGKWVEKGERPDILELFTYRTNR